MLAFRSLQWPIKINRARSHEFLEIENNQKTKARSKSIDMFLCHGNSTAIRLPESDLCFRCMNSSCFSPAIEHSLQGKVRWPIFSC